MAGEGDRVVSYRTISEESRKARKPHRCIWCGQTIEVGQRYTHRRGVFEGDLQTDDWHPECEKAAEEEMRAEGGYWEFSPYEGQRPAPNPAPQEHASD